MIDRPLALALVVAARFGLLLGLALWIGAGAGLLLSVPLVRSRVGAPLGGEVAEALATRIGKLLLTAAGIVVVAMAARLVLDHAAPPGSLVVPVSVMLGARLLAMLALVPAVRALLGRHRDPAAPATDVERAALARLRGAAFLLITVEVCVGLYALFAVS